MNPSNIELENLSKLFEYERMAREIDECNDLEALKNISKSYVKLYLKQEETILNLGLPL
jgi:hypothetical protein